MKEEEIHHIVSFQEHIGTWVALMALTVMTISVSVFGADLLSLSVVTALAIATTKAVVVGYYFMHLKYEPKMYLLLVGITMTLFIVFIVLTTFDYLFR